VVVVSSELAELAGLCDRILVVADGRPTALVDGAGATEADLLAHALPHDQEAATP
jgi:ABC-type sugar transport system ATPase subunit